MRMTKKNSVRLVIFVTFITNCLCVALLLMALGTRSWVKADCVNEKEEEGYGFSKFGLFSGEATFIILSQLKNHYRIVCLEHQCMYSSGDTKEDRQESINGILNSKSTTKTDKQMMYDILKGENDRKVPYVTGIRADKRAAENSLSSSRLVGIVETSTTAFNDTEVDNNSAPELMSEGLWVATIAMLCGALLFAVAGAIFAVINTATTPIEFITGVPGLYIWNGSAAVFALVCVICWGVQYSVHLTSNVLIEDAEDGWTTEGYEHLGYSYWLVVVSAVVHLANCVLIAIGTFERKVKTQYEVPETKTGNHMLY